MEAFTKASSAALRVRVSGTVQGVGFRPFVYRLAHRHALMGWVLNGERGVDIHIEGEPERLEAFLDELQTEAPSAAQVARLEYHSTSPLGASSFEIRSSEHEARPTVRISPDLPVCESCLKELRDPADARGGYPYITCTDCGPRYSIILGLPYDRPLTTLRDWPLCERCARDYQDPLNRRFHAQPLACPNCGPTYALQASWGFVRGAGPAIHQAAKLLKKGEVLAIKGLGGYHLACDARNAEAVATLRARKRRKEKPFALMVKDLATAERLVNLHKSERDLLTSLARPIVLARAKTDLPGVAPNRDDLGLMLPYTPLHQLLFDALAPDALVMTSANHSSEPIAYKDDEARERLADLADAFLIGEREIARRVDDSVARVSVYGLQVLRRARGYAPGAVTELPLTTPLLALGADLKNSVTLVVNGQAFVSQHLGDLEHYEAYKAFTQTIGDLTRMYEVDLEDCLLVHDKHPGYRSSQYAAKVPVKRRVTVQHHQAHIASVLAERGAWDKRVLGVAFDGNGYGDDESIWGGELFVGSVAAGFTRAAHLKPAKLPGGDAAAKHPVQAAAGFLHGLELPLQAPPFNFPPLYQHALALIDKDIQTFPTTSVGRLFDSAAALLGFTRKMSFEGQAAMWLEQLARTANNVRGYPFPFNGKELDYTPLLRAVAEERQLGMPAEVISRAFHEAIADGIVAAANNLCESYELDVVVLSGGVFQNALLLELLKGRFDATSLTVWTNQAVPPNDGGVSLGQAALAAFAD